MLEFVADFDPHKLAITLQQITQWFGYDVILTCEVVPRDRLHKTEQCREEPDPSPSLDVIASVQHIKQQVERVTQSIAN